MQIAVIDGQGGGIGRVIVEKLRAQYGNRVGILALGTNPLATSAMLKAGADAGASGEYAVVQNAPKADVIAGCIGILTAGSMMGEITPAMAQAVSLSRAEKVVIPLAKCGIHVAGVVGKPLPQYIGDVLAAVGEIAERSSRRGTDVYFAGEDGKRTLVLKNAEKIIPGDGRVTIRSRGEQKSLEAQIEELDLAAGRVVLRKPEAGRRAKAGTAGEGET